ncbi:Replication factor RFC1 C terminal domain protein [Cryptosporidium meleagridis]|uniref:Replication factor C subunit 1 n=1 Tax=Cryptosporidium meleagridis TaxID=93969 RepID=A0A2P4Z5W7_9CRYT|nr:Replication factor RFC1 C terminal domain protein [Cryptosporidium meleagridis]
MELTLDDYFSSCKRKLQDNEKVDSDIQINKDKKNKVNINNDNETKDDEIKLKKTSKRSRLQKVMSSDEDEEEDVKSPLSRRKRDVNVKAKQENSPKRSKSSKSNLNTKTDKTSSNSQDDEELIGPFKGMSIVVTGTFKSNSRQEIEDFVKILGGKLTSAVSGRTSYLIAGSSLEDGRSIEEGSKYRNAKSKGVKILSEDEFIEIYTNYKQKETKYDNQSPNRKSHGVFESGIKRNEGNVSNFNFDGNNSLWTDRHRPESLDQVLGNGEVIKKLQTWLSDWRSVVIEGKKKAPPKASFSPGSRFPQVENINARAALLSGPPGIGKSTVATLIANKCGYIPIEMNASDDRTKEVIENLSESAVGGFSLSTFARKSSPGSQFSEEGGLNTNMLLIMDEMDGLGGSDRGGAAALGRLIQKTRWPIICICNDRMSEKVRNLAPKCYDLRFSRPSKVQIIKRMQEIANKEGMKIEPNAIELLCESVGNDLRQILNELQLLSLSNINVRFSDIKAEISGHLKDVQVTLDVFSATKKLLTTSESSHLSIHDKLEIFFIDFDLMPLLLEENYISALSVRSGGGFGPGSSNQQMTVTPQMIESVLESANLFVEADIFNSKLRTDNEWSLLSEIAVNCAVGPGLCSTNSFLARPEFPKWLGKNSTTNKNKRLLSELMAIITVGRKGNCPSSKGLRLSGYLDLIYFKATAPLLDSKMDTKDAIQMSISFMDEYCLNRNHLIEHISSLMLKNQVRNYDKVDSKTKSTMTRIINSTTHAVKFSIQSKKNNKSEDSDELSRKGEEDQDDGGEDEFDESENDDQGEGSSKSSGTKSKGTNDLGSLIKVKKSKASGRQTKETKKKTK